MSLGLILISAVIKLVAHSIKQNTIVSSEVELQENFYYLNSELKRIFSNALSSPCGISIDTLMAHNNLRRATISDIGGEYPQSLINVITTKNNNVNVLPTEFPIFSVGIAGSGNEPLNSYGKPFSQSLSNIVAGSQYIIVMQSATPIKPQFDNNTNKGITGGNQGDIQTTKNDYRVNIRPVPYIITNCQQADIFLPSAKTKKYSIPLNNNLKFSHSYKRDETILYPVKLYAYYLSQPKGIDSRSFSRTNLSLTRIDHKPASQPLIAGVQDIKFEWGLSATDTTHSLQGFFTTEQVASSTMTPSDFRNRLISVKATVTVKNINTKNNFKHEKQVTKTRQQIFTLRNQVIRRITQ